MPVVKISLTEPQAGKPGTPPPAAHHSMHGKDTMRTRIRTAMLGIISSAIVAGGVTLTAPAAFADWNGDCYITHDGTSSTGSAWGWCDGTGPQKFQVGVKCSNQTWYWSANSHAFGDQRDLIAYCPTGKKAIQHTMRRA